MKSITLVLLISLFTLPIIAQTEITDDEALETLFVQNDKIVFLDLYATWCAPCKTMDPILKELAEENKDVSFYKMDVDKNGIDEAMKVNSVPTYIIIKNGVAQRKIEGTRSKDELLEFINDNSNTTTNAYNVLKNHGKANEFSDAAIKAIKHSSDNLNSLAWHAYKEHDDKATLLKAISMVEKSIELNKNYANVDTLAALYYKTGDYIIALKTAKEAIYLAEDEGEDNTSTSILIFDIIDKL